MDTARRTLQLAVTPVFLVLAALNFVQPSPLCTIPGPYGYLTSMWFMYVVMAVAHSGIWFPIFARVMSKHAAAPLVSFESCCDPLPAETSKRQEMRGQSRQLA